MRSKVGVLATVALLSAIPITVLVSNVTGIDDEVIIHLCFATGVTLLAFAVLDFKVAKSITWVGRLSMAALAVIFFLQAVSSAVDNETLHDFAYDILGQGLESVFIDVFLIWCLAVLLVDSEGKTRLFGFVAVSLVLSAEIYRYSSLSAGNEAPEILKLLLIQPIVWLLLESRKSTSPAPGRPTPILAPTS